MRLLYTTDFSGAICFRVSGCGEATSRCASSGGHGTRTRNRLPGN